MTKEPQYINFDELTSKFSIDFIQQQYVKKVDDNFGNSKFNKTRNLVFFILIIFILLFSNYAKNTSYKKSIKQNIDTQKIHLSINNQKIDDKKIFYNTLSKNLDNKINASDISFIQHAFSL